jgi:hypothetical protein
MPTTVYLSERLKKFFDEATVVVSDEVEDHEILLVNPDSMISAVLEAKSQVSADRAAVRYSADKDKLKVFLRSSKEPKKEVTDDTRTEENKEGERRIIQTQ